MTDSNLIDLLKTFSSEEIKKLEEFIVSPYFNNSERVIKLFKIIRKYHPEFVNINLSKIKIYNKLFPGKKYQDNTLRVLIHYLSSLIERYFAISRFEKNKAEYGLYLSGELFNRRMYKMYERVYNQSIKLLEKTEIKNDDHYYYKYKFESENFTSISTSNSGIYERFLDKVNINNITDELTYYYLSKCLKSYNMILNLERSYNKIFNTESFKELYAKIDISLYSNVPVIEIYYYLIKLQLKIENESYFYKVKDLLRLNKNSLDILEVTNIYINLGNYCIRNVQMGKKNFRKERFIIYKEEIKDETYLINGYMSPKYYVNAVNAGLQINEYKWVRDFINKFKSTIQKENRDNLFYYCSALYHFYIREFEQCLETLSKVIYEDSYLNLQIRTLQLMTHYEMEHEESLYSSLDSFRHFIKNNKLIPAEQKNIFSTFITFLNKIIKHSSDSGSYDFKKLKNDLIKERATNKEWLLRKIEDLIMK